MHSPCEPQLLPPATSATRGQVSPGDQHDAKTVTGSCRVIPGDQRDAMTGRPRRPARAGSPPATGSCRVTPGDRLVPGQPRRPARAGSPPATGSCRVTPGDQRDAMTGRPRRPAHAFPGRPAATSLARARLAVSLPVNSLPTLLASNPIGFTDKFDDKGSSGEPVLTGYEQRE
ncbi:collagen alpha-1(III) chain-like [Brassica napus]|uniref:collagen alpha-1(III) chain-like n=1 Tax=Brassica napus TaxID=3708 RepID=UPI0020799D0A|nr:collagen alpha-1(III) chain-like [Brassica napus]